MLNSIKLTNFRRHRSLAVTFGAGMTAIRALNEQGKTTLLEAIAYACSGVKAIRDSLDDVVTWGEPVNTLKVELDIAVDNVVYSVKRSKTAAEVNYDGGIVTGQTEVTNFIAKLLKMDAGASARLTLSNQNAIRGALEEGPKATTELIERLADFDVIDQLIETMQEKLTLGSSATLDAQLAAKEQGLARAQEAAQPYDDGAAQTVISEAHHDLLSAEALCLLAAQEEDKAQNEYAAVREQAATRRALVQVYERSRAKLVVAQSNLSRVVLPTKPDNVEGQVEFLQHSILEAEKYAHVSELHERVKPFFTREEGPNYTGSMAELGERISEASSDLQGFREDVATLKGKEALAAQKILAGTCTFCGKDFSGVPEVAAKNAELTAELMAAQALGVSSAAAVESLTLELAQLQGIEKRSRAAFVGVASAPDFVKLVDGVLPPVFQWTGPAITDTLPNVSAMRRQIKELQESQRTYDTATVRFSEAAAQLSLAEAAVTEATQTMEAAPDVDATKAQTDLDAARQAHGESRQWQATRTNALREAERSLETLQTNYLMAAKELSTLEESIELDRANLKVLEFNNALLKRVRQCRPLISDKLWSIVLAAVSSYFSEIRGEKSRVTKDSGGFKVDGHPITSMSGSTLDALGLAIRVALVRTFLPSAPFLILDEPGAAMDADRTGNMLGFLASCGFQQILLVTHEETSSDVADHIISL